MWLEGLHPRKASSFREKAPVSWETENVIPPGTSTVSGIRHYDSRCNAKPNGVVLRVSLGLGQKASESPCVFLALAFEQTVFCRRDALVVPCAHRLANPEASSSTSESNRCFQLSSPGCFPLSSWRYPHCADRLSGLACVWEEFKSGSLAARRSLSRSSEPTEALPFVIPD